MVFPARSGGGRCFKEFGPRVSSRFRSAGVISIWRPACFCRPRRGRYPERGKLLKRGCSSAVGARDSAASSAARNDWRRTCDAADRRTEGQPRSPYLSRARSRACWSRPRGARSRCQQRGNPSSRQLRRRRHLGLGASRPFEADRRPEARSAREALAKATFAATGRSVWVEAYDGRSYPFRFNIGQLSAVAYRVDPPGVHGNVVPAASCAPGHQVPEAPLSLLLPLSVLGVVGLGFARRRRSATES